MGRLKQQRTNLVNGAYTRFEYPNGSQIRIDTYATIQEGLGEESHSLRITDGIGRVIATGQWIIPAGGDLSVDKEDDL